MSRRLNPSHAAAFLGGVAATMLLSRALAAPGTNRREPPVRLVGGANRKRHRVVVVGAGFGGLQAATRLARMPEVELRVLDKRNYHLFQPLLYQVATAVLSADDIASPIRAIITLSPRTRVFMERVTGIDTAGRRVLCEGRTVDYDTLLIATGSEVSYFGHESWRASAPGLKDLDDALGLRRQILDCFERAALVIDDPAERARLLTFVLVGGGPTGVEMAGSIAELARSILAREFHVLENMVPRVVLIEAGMRVLPEFPPDLSRSALQDLQELGVEVRTGTPVTDITHDVVHLKDGDIAAETIIWTAGVTATPVAAWLGIEPDRHGRVRVDPDLRVPGHPDIYVIGDAATVHDRRGKPLPGLAPVAKQQGTYVAARIARRLRGRGDGPAFVYRDYGNLATIGRNKAVAEFGKVHLTGVPAWTAWAGAHIFFLIGFRNRVLVSLQWVFSYVIHQRGGRAIT